MIFSMFLPEYRNPNIWVIAMFMKITFILLLAGFILIYNGFPLFSQKRWKELMIVGSLLLFSLYIFFGFYGFIPYVNLKDILEMMTKPVSTLLGI